MAEKRLRLAWIVPQLSASVASTRYRCYYPAIALAELGVESQYFTDPRLLKPYLDSIDALIIVKIFDRARLEVAAEAKARGVKIFLDLCDNVVVSTYSRDRNLGQTANLVGIAAFADAVVFASPALRDAVRPLLPSANLVVIPDQVETRETIFAAAKVAESMILVAATGENKIKKVFRQLRRSSKDIPRFVGRARRLARRVAVEAFSPRTLLGKILRFALMIVRDPVNAVVVARRWIDRRRLLPDAGGVEVAVPKAISQTRLQDVPCALKSAPSGMPNPLQTGRKSVLWFGNYGAPHSDFGMLALLQAVGALEVVAKDFPLELVVISNNEDVFNSFIRPISVPTRYLTWSAEAVFEALASSDLCLLPFGNDPFSVTKSANRAVLALQHGVPVVTSRLASMEPLSDAVMFDDWEAGLRHYLGPGGEANRVRSVRAARGILESHYSSAETGRSWFAVLTTQSKRLRFGYANRQSEIEIGVLLNLAQDLDILLPVIDALRRASGVLLRVLVTPNLINSSHRVLRAMIDRAIVPFALEAELVVNGEDRILRNLDVLLTASETSLNVHKVAHALTETANKLGIATFTLQHGLENVGLSYFDETHGTEVRFAAKHILTWSDPANFPAILAPETRAKCIPVGRSSHLQPTTSEALPGMMAGRRVISVFENLHWHRYSEAYRTSFLRDLVALCQAKPDLTVLLKPHHAGRYFSRNRELLNPIPTNLIFADPLDPVWEPYTAPAIIQQSFAVITTPSTVALDAAELGRPVAVISFDLDLPVFSGIPKLAETQDWISFVDEAIARPDAATVRAALFRDKARMPGDAVERIVKAVLEEGRARQLTKSAK